MAGGRRHHRPARAGRRGRVPARGRDALPAEPWDAEVWTRWTEALRATTGRRGRALFHPLRVALTGEEEGPAMRALLPLIGRERAAARLAMAG